MERIGITKKDSRDVVKIFGATSTNYLSSGEELNSSF